MITDAEGRRERAEKLLAESQLKVELLEAEVKALKMAIKAVSPSRRLAKLSGHRLLQSTPSNSGYIIIYAR